MDCLALTLNANGTLREETLHGRQYVVATGTLIVPGVLPGSQGPLYYSAEELGKDPSIWNGIPLVGRHPTVNNVPVSARTPNILAQQGLGFVFNTSFDGKLRTEYWFDTVLTAAFDESLDAAVRILPRLRSNLPIEMSTGLFTTNEEAPAGSSFNGSAYVGVATDYRPDHVAVLPDQTGACGIGDGCGILVNQKAEQGMLTGILTRLARAMGLGTAPTTNELSHGDIRDALMMALRSQYKQSDPNCWICDVYDDYFIYEQDEQSYRMDYTATDSGVELQGTPQPVLRQVQYLPVSSEDTSMAMTANERKDKITFLTTNCACWKDPKHQPLLNSMTDDQLVALEAGAKVPPALPEAPILPQGFSPEQMDRLASLVADKLKATPPAPVVPTPVAAPVTVNEYLASAPPEIRDALTTSLSITHGHRAQLLERLVTNVTDEAAKKVHLERLAKKDTPELEYLVGLLPPPVTNGYREQPALYIGGSGAPPVANEAVDADVLVPPSLDYEAMIKERVAS